MQELTRCRPNET